VATALPTPIQRLLHLASEQHGVVSRTQARLYGLTDRAIRGAVAHDVLEPLHRQVLRATGSAVTWEQKLLAAVFAGGSGTVASHRSTARLAALDRFDDEHVEIAVPHDHRTYVAPKGIDVVTHWTSRLDECDTTTFSAIPSMTVLRMLLCLGAVVSRANVVRALDCAERAELVKRDDLLARLADVRESGRTGIRVIAEILERREALRLLPRTVLERHLLDALREAGLPAPVTQYPFRRPGIRKAFLDFAWVVFKLAVEADGGIAHALPEQRRSDYARDRDVQLQDWRILRFTYEEIMYETPKVISELRTHLRSRGAVA
jgi:very-short-patch-repair endonuclease